MIDQSTVPDGPRLVDGIGIVRWDRDDEQAVFDGLSMLV